MDDAPYGGGPGMVMMCQPLWDAVTAVEAADPRPARRILLTPHIAGVTRQASAFLFRTAWQNVKRVLIDRQPPDNRVY